MEACAWQGVGHGVDIWDQFLGGINLSAYALYGKVAIPASAYKQGIGVAFKQPVIILHVSFRAVSTCLVCLERPHEEQAYSAVEMRQCGCSYGCWSLLISTNNRYSVIE